jgi:NAD(P)H-quinone oxidoreductase subunit 5
MVMAMGIGAYSAGLFHLMTHAYFKAMLFLCSGSVIHGMENVVGHNAVLAQDMRLMGGLRKYMPLTSLAFLVGTLAICGIPPFAGFWSKDEILGLAYQSNPLLWLVGWITAGITAFYMFRMYFMTFEGNFKGNDMAIRTKLLSVANSGPKGTDDSKSEDHSTNHHGNSLPHESPLTMTLPLLILAIPSTIIGLLGRPWNNNFEDFIHAPGEIVEKVSHFDWVEFDIMAGASVGIATIGIVIAFLMYLQHKIDPNTIAERYPTLYKFSLNKWYFDDVYNQVFVIGCRRLARQIMEVDYRVIDGVVNLTGLTTLVSGEGLKYFESGRVQFYALVLFGAVLGFVIVSSTT